MNSTILDIFELISRLADLSLRLRFTTNMFRRIGAQSFHCENNFQFKGPELPLSTAFGQFAFGQRVI